MQSIRHKPAGRFEATRYEKVYNVIFQDSKQGLLQVAKEISDLIREKTGKGQKCVLGASGGSEQGNHKKMPVSQLGKLCSHGDFCEI